MASYLVTADYEVIDRAPLTLAEGDAVRLGPPDSDWPGWVWVTAINGRGSYVPEDHLTAVGDGSAHVTTAFQARDLSVCKGDQIESLREVKGWHWSRDQRGNEGWLPSYLLRSTTDLA
jgi:hypothetical protein